MCLNNKLTVRKATADEIEIVFNMLEEAALWLQNKQIDYWQDWLNPPKPYVDWIADGFAQEQFYLVYKGAQQIGCFRLQWQDTLFWGNQKDNAGYVHSLTISRALAGEGVGARVLELIEQMCRNNSKKFIRLDCGAHIVGLCRYYENLGFLPMGEVVVEGEKLTLYEKELL